jgi:hypothetical protein
MRAVRILAIAACVVGACFPASTSAALYVDRDSRGGACSDSREPRRASSAHKPWCSLDRAAAAAPSGSTVRVRGGNYPELSIDGDAGRAARVVFRPARGERVTLDGLTVEHAVGFRFERLRFTGPVFLRDARQIALVRNEFPGQFVWLDETTDVLVARNHIHDIPAGSDGKIGIRDLGGQGTVIRGNRIENLVEDPIQVAAVRNVLVEGNVARNAHPVDGEHTDAMQVLGADGLVIRGNDFRNIQHGLMFTDGQAANVEIVNNVVADIDAGVGMKAEGGNGMPGLRLLGNTFYDTALGVNLRARHPGAVVANNIFDTVDGLGDQPVATNNLIGKPRPGVNYGAQAIRRAARFTDAGSLQLAAGSPGIDAGTSAYGARRDRRGRRRVDDPRKRNTGQGRIRYTDVGAYERIPKRRQRRR